MTECDIAVVGGGLAAFSAAVEAARLGRSCAVLSGTVPGGLLLSIESIQGLPGLPDGIAGYDLCPMLQEQAMDAGVVCIGAEANGLRSDRDAWHVSWSEGELRARSVVVASGSRLRKLGVPGEDRLAGKGVSQCASCDAPLLRGKVVAVVGGGDAACQETLTLADHARTVHVLVRGPALRAHRHWQDKLSGRANVRLQPCTTVESIEGGAAVEALRWRRTDGNSGTLQVDGVFVFVGLAPNTEWLQGQAALDEAGQVVVDAALRTPLPGLFAAGSVRAGSCGQAAAAAADGIAAAHAAHTLLLGHGHKAA